MSEQLQLRRGTQAQIAVFTGAQGEATPAVDTMRLHIHDGATAGGWPQALETRTAISDTNYSAQITDRQVAYTSITAPRAVTLPPAAAYPTGAVLLLIDESGAVSSANTITVSRVGTDLINGAASIVLSYGRAFVALESNGSNGWTIVNQSTLSMAQQAASAVAITGGAINGVALGGTTPAAGVFTNLKSTGAASFATGGGAVGVGTATPAQPLDVAGIIQTHGANGSTIQLGILEDTVVCAGAISVSTQQIPNRAIVLAVSVRVVTAIAGATSFNVDAATGSGGGAGTTSGQFGSGVGVAAGSTNIGVIGPTAWYAPSTIKLTANGGAFTSGQVRIAIQYLLCGAPTS
jgi:hypothetical protein